MLFIFLWKKNSKEAAKIIEILQSLEEKNYNHSEPLDFLLWQDAQEAAEILEVIKILERLEKKIEV
jgi:hypothetical protein